MVTFCMDPYNTTVNLILHISQLILPRYFSTQNRLSNAAIWHDSRMAQNTMTLYLGFEFSVFLEIIIL